MFLIHLNKESIVNIAKSHFVILVKSVCQLLKHGRFKGAILLGDP